MQGVKEKIIRELQRDILLREGFKPAVPGVKRLVGLESIEAAFPNGVFPVGAVHEFLAEQPEHAAVSSGFISGLLGLLMEQDGICVWVSRARKLFPSALKTFGVHAERIVFVDVQREKEVLWATEEALKCRGVAVIVAEVRELTFMQSRRLQFAVEASKATGIILRNDVRQLSATACVARWQITPMPSQLEEGMPGVGFPRWQVELTRVRNGKPGKWQVAWVAGKFEIVERNRFTINIPDTIRIAG